MIIDEEQRFGVEHKEQLKRLRMDVDVLAMSATPIPRTLEMAITGIREMSTIATPPEERHPVLTFAGPYDEAQLTAAIRRELLREGQVFYIHNRVQSIDKVAKQDRRPGARGPGGHRARSDGRAPARAGDDRLLGAPGRRAGLHHDRRGRPGHLHRQHPADRAGRPARVCPSCTSSGAGSGRGRERGYAYFFYPPDKPLTETAHDRLATIAAHTDLGAGMAVAMKDLEIRGAGNLLGGEQSGHIADVGFDLYIRLVGEAVAEFRGENTEPEPEVRIELPVDAHLPEDYVESERLRLEMYKRLAEVRADSDLDAVGEELTDRYGPLPAAGGDAAGGGPVPAAGPGGRTHRHRHLGQLHPVRPGRAARVAGRCG